MKHGKISTSAGSAENKLYFTSDNLAFFEEHNAVNHAKRLDDKTVIAKTREEVERDLAELTGDAWEDDLTEEHGLAALNL